MTSFDESVDFVVVGSGGGGLTGAIAAHEQGLDTILLEKQHVIGGSTGMSGGIVWVPNNPLMSREGVPDSKEEGRAYLDAVVGDVGPASTPERRESFLEHGPRVISYLEQLGVRWQRDEGYSDYYPESPGGKARGRAVEVVPFDGRVLGEWSERLTPAITRDIGLVASTNELRLIQYYNRDPRCLYTAAKVWLRTYAARARGQKLMTNGAGLVASLLQIILERNIRFHTDAPLTELIVEDGRAVGVGTVIDGAPMRIEARRGVLLASGGFAHNADMRRRYSGDQPNQAEWSVANPGDTGEVLEAAIEKGVMTDLLDEAWWSPNTIGLGWRTTLRAARQRPGAILVDAAGERFCNESNNYVEVGKAMYARDKVHRAVPCWLIIDDGYRRRYAQAKTLPGRMPKDWIRKGLVKKAESIDDLARICGIDPEGLAATIERFNANAVKGIDPDFGRGESAYNDCLGDPLYKPNRSLGPIDRPPFYATAIVPGDVGTCGGIVCDEHGQALDKQGGPIPGLYATGNGTATVQGRKYLGPGGSISYTMVFGYLAALHAAGVDAPA